MDAFVAMVVTEATANGTTTGGVRCADGTKRFTPIA